MAMNQFMSCWSVTGIPSIRANNAASFFRKSLWQFKKRTLGQFSLYCGIEMVFEDADYVLILGVVFVPFFPSRRLVRRRSYTGLVLHFSCSCGYVSVVYALSAEAVNQMVSVELSIALW
jgi:hypothetical protein